MQASESNFSDVIIIGGGPAGIGAASVLRENKVDYVILEARLRMGGRAQSYEIDDVRVDLGAWWVHSFSESNPIAKYIEEFKIELYPCGLKDRVYLDGEEGKPFEQEVLDKVKKIHDEYFLVSEKHAQDFQDDISVHEAAKDFYQQAISSMKPEEKRCLDVMIHCTERHESASTKELSAKNYQYILEKGDNRRPIEGYAHLFRNLSAGMNVELNKEVIEIDRSSKVIKLLCSDGSSYSCSKLLVSIPLGVLKTERIKFIPALPEGHQKSIRNLGFGLMNKVYMSFSEQFWGDCDWISVAFDQRGKFPFFFDFSHSNRFLLCCFISEDFARSYQSKPDEEIVGEIVAELKKIYPQSKVQLREAYLTRWGQDKYCLGSYSSFKVGSSSQDSYRLRTPIEEKLWFIGEHCYAEHIGTAHGAFKTGCNAAEQVSLLLKNDK